MGSSLMTCRHSHPNICDSCKRVRILRKKLYNEQQKRIARAMTGRYKIRPVTADPDAGYRTDMPW